MRETIDDPSGAGIKTTCKFGACEPQCGLEFDVRDGRIVKAKPDKSHPISKGYACIKGMAVPEYQNDPDRLLHPLKRDGEDWQQVSWQQATTDIGQQLRKIRDTYGPNAIATYWGNAADTTAMIAANTLCAGLGSPNSFNVLSLEYTDRGAVAKEVLGEQTLILQPDADNTHFALLLGTNPLVTQGMTLLQRRPRIGGDLKAIRHRGGKVVVVDPRVTETTKVSDQHIMIRPGTDLYLLLGFLKVILDENLADQQFVRKYCRSFQKLQSFIHRVDLPAVAVLTGIDEDIINTLAREFGRASSAFVTTRVGVQTGPNTTLTEWAVLTLNAVTGNIDRPGGVYFNPGALDNTAIIHKFTRRKNPAPSRIGAYPQIFGGPPATVFSDDVLSDSPDRIRALIVIAGNPVMSFPATEKVERALEKLDLLVSIDLYVSDTGSFADYNLPAATIYEKGGLHFLTQPFEPFPYAEWRKKIVPPLGEARPEWDITRDIARAAKIPFLNNPAIDFIDRFLGFFGSGFSEEHLAQYLFWSPMANRKLSVRRLKKADGGIKCGDIQWGHFLDSGIRTPDGKIQLLPTNYQSELQRLIAAPADKSSTDSDPYPFRLISGGRRLATFNSWSHNLPKLTAKIDGNNAVMNRQDAEALGIAEGSTIRVTSSTGSITIPVQLTPDILPGVVMIHQFWGHKYKSGQSKARQKPGVNVNELHDDQWRDFFCGMPVYNGTPVNIEAKEAAGGVAIG